MTRRSARTAMGMAQVGGAARIRIDERGLLRCMTHESR